MTVTLMHLQGARLAIRTAPERAEEALGQAERLARLSLDDLRRTVRLLSEDWDPSLEPPVDLRDDVEHLVAVFVDAGENVRLEFAGDDQKLAPVVAQTVFRVIQEALTNAARHAPRGPVIVKISVNDERVQLRVENEDATASQRAASRLGGGHGLRGIFDRVALISGHVDAGPTKQGWLVTGWVPREQPLTGLTQGAT